MDRYISLRYKGLGVTKINQESIRQSTTPGHVYLVKSIFMQKGSMKLTLKNGHALVQLVEQDILVVNRANINTQ